MISEYPASYCLLARGTVQVYLLYFYSVAGRNKDCHVNEMVKICQYLKEMKLDHYLQVTGALDKYNISPNFIKTKLDFLFYQNCWHG